MYFSKDHPSSIDYSLHFGMPKPGRTRNASVLSGTRPVANTQGRREAKNVRILEAIDPKTKKHLKHQPGYGKYVDLGEVSGSDGELDKKWGIEGDTLDLDPRTRKKLEARGLLPKAETTDVSKTPNVEKMSPRKRRKIAAEPLSVTPEKSSKKKNLAASNRPKRSGFNTKPAPLVRRLTLKEKLRMLARGEELPESSSERGNSPSDHQRLSRSQNLMSEDKFVSRKMQGSLSVSDARSPLMPTVASSVDDAPVERLSSQSVTHSPAAESRGNSAAKSPVLSARGESTPHSNALRPQSSTQVIPEETPVKHTPITLGASPSASATMIQSQPFMQEIAPSGFTAINANPLQATTMPLTPQNKKLGKNGKSQPASAFHTPYPDRVQRVNQWRAKKKAERATQKSAIADPQTPTAAPSPKRVENAFSPIPVVQDLPVTQTAPLSPRHSNTGQSLAPNPSASMTQAGFVLGGLPPIRLQQTPETLTNLSSKMVNAAQLRASITDVLADQPVNNLLRNVYGEQGERLRKLFDDFHAMAHAPENTNASRAIDANILHQIRDLAARPPSPQPPGSNSYPVNHASMDYLKKYYAPAGQ